MDFIEHITGNGSVVEVRSKEVVIHSEQDALDIIANIEYLYDCNRIIIHK